MRFIFIVGQGLADEPVQDLEARTPLELAKTPFLDLLAKKGKVGSACFSPHTLGPSYDSACFSILGFDPKEFYTGLGPLEARAFGIGGGPESVYFRLNLVTVLDEAMLDATAGDISLKEAALLMDTLNEKLSGRSLKLYSKDGYRNILEFCPKDFAESLDGITCFPPKNLVGQKYTAYLPKGPGADALADAMEQSKGLLENHEINRVRIDLRENPANMVWPWGGGKMPKLPNFEQRFGLKGSAYSNVTFARGLLKTLSLKVEEDWQKALCADSFSFFYIGREKAFDVNEDLKSKIKRIEEFDAFVGGIMKKIEGETHARVCVTTDCAGSLEKKALFHSSVPFLIQGEGIAVDTLEAYHEKNASQSGWVFEEGRKLMSYFLNRD